MTLYLDSADRAALGPLLETGLFAGITTNPLLLHRAGLTQRDLPALHDWAVGVGARTVFLQTIGADVSALVVDGRRLRSLSNHVVVKVPATSAGLTASRILIEEGVPLLVTAVYHAAQALLAAAAGAQFIAPYLGRMTDAGRDGLTEIITMQHILTHTTTEILVASIRTVDDLVTLAAAGVPTFTLGPPLATAVLGDELTILAAQEFEDITQVE